jgi:hypothetical protein
VVLFWRSPDSLGAGRISALISALIAAALLLLGPGLACGQSPAGLLREPSNSLRASVRAPECCLIRQSLEDLQMMPVVAELSQPSDLAHSSGCNSDFKRWRGWAEARVSGNARRRFVRSAGTSVSAPALGVPPFRFAASSASVLAFTAGGAGLHPSFLKAVQPWLRGGYLDGSEHGDPADNKHGTFSAVSSLPLSPPEIQHPHRKIHRQGSSDRLLSGFWLPALHLPALHLPALHLPALHLPALHLPACSSLKKPSTPSFRGAEGDEESRRAAGDMNVQT